MSGNFSSVDVPYLSDCLLAGSSPFILGSSMLVTIVLVLPLCVFVVSLGLQQWRSSSSSSCSSSSSSSCGTASHSDVLTFHMVAVELVGVGRALLTCCAVFWRDIELLMAGTLLLAFIWHGQVLFHVLTCVERYLAVVHPVTYRGLRNKRGARIRNAAIVCVWLSCFLLVYLARIINEFLIVNFCLTVSFVAVVCFFNVSVLRVLNRSGPGERRGDRKRANRTRRRAFYTIAAIGLALVLRMVWNLLWSVFFFSGLHAECQLGAYGAWFGLPSSLVLPLLFLLRKGRIPGWRRRNPTSSRETRQPPRRPDIS